jgi:hypothetical protein
MFERVGFPIVWVFIFKEDNIRCTGHHVYKLEISSGGFARMVASVLLN